ncbi:hypothetical protein [Streptomyces sp. NPDC000134]|uniref:hypothetical protein n=1 Tax=Streptomyces sp. NPDC000134 TaxID=3364536 RepID=UPI0036B0F126
MAVLLALLIPVLMLGVVLALGCYEDLLLPGADAEPTPDTPAPALDPAVPAAGPVPAPAPAGTAAVSL